MNTFEQQNMKTPKPQKHDKLKAELKTTSVTHKINTFDKMSEWCWACNIFHIQNISIQADLNNNNYYYYYNNNYNSLRSSAQWQVYENLHHYSRLQCPLRVLVVSC